ncbi:MAG: NAD(P)-dependent oxidoreductase [Patescibacteria group bacterium]
MKVFITGGTGFVGRPTVARLLERGHVVFLLVRNFDRATKIFGKSKRLIFVKGGLSHTSPWKHTIKKLKPDACIHLAWEDIPDYGVDTSVKNMEQSIVLFRILGEAKCKRIIATGTCWEYGAATGKLREDMGLSPMLPYTAAKTAVHWLGKEIAERAGMEFYWTRLFFVYGPGRKSPSLISHLIASKKIDNHPKLEKPLDGRDFIYVEDVANVLVKLVESRGKNPYAVYNIGTGKLTSNARIANLVYGKKILREPRKPKGFWADISKIKKELEWRPTIFPKEGVKMTLEYSGRNKEEYESR